MGGSEFLFNFLDGIFDQFSSVGINLSGSSIDSPNQIRFFHYAVTVELNYENIGVHPERIAKIMPFVHSYN